MVGIAILSSPSATRMMSSGPGCNMRIETPQFELALLRKQQAKTREDEVFGGLTPAERAAYELRQDRIRELQSALSERSGERQRSPERSRINR